MAHGSRNEIAPRAGVTALGLGQFFGTSIYSANRKIRRSVRCRFYFKPLISTAP
jgi:hypothetical protein